MLAIRFRAARIGQAETLWPDQDPADDQQHDLRHPWPRQQRHDQRGQRRDNPDRQQRTQHDREIVVRDGRIVTGDAER